jgi:hypothetical protein
MRVDQVDAAMAIRPYMGSLLLNGSSCQAASINSFRRNSSRSTSSATDSARKRQVRPSAADLGAAGGLIYDARPPPI